MKIVFRGKKYTSDADNEGAISLKKMTASDVKMGFGNFIKTAQKEEVIIVKNGIPLLRVTPIRKTDARLIDELFDWGVSGLKEEQVLDSMMEKYYGN